jgi:hypothetical protein
VEGRLQPQDFASPAILLGGPVDYDMYKSFRSQLDRSKKEGLFVTELSTLGGDPEVARMMGEDIRFHSEHSQSARFVFLGKAAIYSAGNHLHELLFSGKSISDSRNSFDDS